MTEAAPIPISPEHARQRASVVAITIGVVQLIGSMMMYDSAGEETSLFVHGATAIVGVGGAVYLLLGIPARLNVRAALAVVLAAALVQSIVYVALAGMSILAGITSGSQGSMTSGVLLFGSIATLHIFVVKWFWRGYQAQ